MSNLERMNWKKLMSPVRARDVSNRPKSPTDLRSEFEKDYQRIISSSSFRRLQDKTQVFPLDKSDFIRTRLTHSLEVANFARSIGRMLGMRIINEGIDPDFDMQTKDDICAVLECSGLLHDIGNPPFGHFGEDAIRDWFKANLDKYEYNGKPLSEVLNPQQIGDFVHFEGNTQALRVVTKLHFMVDKYGMNLTQALLCTIMKYPGSSLEIGYDKKDPDRDIARKKMGYFYADRETFLRASESCGTFGRRHPLAFCLEAADDIAYKTADIEDAVKKGLLDVPTLVREMQAAVDAAKLVEFMGEGDVDKINQTEFMGKADADKIDRTEFIGKANTDKIDQTEWLINKLKSKYEQAIDCGYENPNLYAIQNWVVRVQGIMLTCAVESFIDNYDSIMEGNYKTELLSNTRGELVMDVLGDVAYRYAFITEPILKLEVAADTIFNYLLDRLVRALVYYDTSLWKEKSSSVDQKMIGLISSSFMQTYKFYSEGCSEEDKLYLRLLLATDYVSGMTDSYAKRLYQELRGID